MSGSGAVVVERPRPPVRWQKPPLVVWLVGLVFLAFFLHGMTISELTPERFAKGAGRLASFLGEAFPPSFQRLPSVAKAALVTFEMAVVGTLAGALISLPLGLLASRNTTPHRAVYYVARGLIALFRAVPDLVWGLIFVVAVGLGPGPGILAITVDVIGFCGRFFAERIEEIDPGPVEGLRAIGASNLGIIAGAIVPAALPSFVASTMFSLESSVRSAVVLGLVGAGGIGVELSTSMQLMRYSEALTVILVVFAIVIAVERLSASIRTRLI